MKPLEGIRVADFTHIMAGPYATHLLRLLGADVIKIESPVSGDAFRYYGADAAYAGMSPAFIAVNAGKKSVTLDLKNPKSQEAARRLIAATDVVVENFRPGVMARFGLGFEAVRSLRSDIVYCSVSGFGQSGPMRDWPAIDNIVQASSGMMALSGEPGDPPVRVGFPVVDTLTGQTAAFAILAALLRRERVGGGEYIDVAMLDASLAFMASAVVPYLVTGKAQERTGNTGYSGQPTAAMFEASDGNLLSLGVVQQSQFVALARALGKPEWPSEPRFADTECRRANGEALKQLMASELKRRPAEEWERVLSAAGIPCGMVRSPAEAVRLSQLDERGLRIPLKIAGLPRENIEILNAGFRFSADGPMVSTPPPRLGEHTQEVLASLGFSDAEIAEIVRVPST